MRMPLQSDPVERDRRLHPHRGLVPDENGVYPAILVSQDLDDEDDEDDYD